MTATSRAQAGAPTGMVVSRSVNMVAGDKWPTGDPYLQRQNEPSVAASTRNPQHLLAGANDYRTVDMPGLPSETGDAWLGIFKSVDGGERWQTNLLPGYPQDTSAEGMASPIKGYQAGADPVVRPGTNGLLYYAGLAFNRGENQPSAVFLSRFIDNNNTENGDPIKYLGTTIIDKSTGADFIDKPWMAVDIPRTGAKSCRIVVSQPAPAVQPPAKSWGRYSGWKKSEEKRREREREDAKRGKKPLPKPSKDPRLVAQSIDAGRIYVAYSRIKTVGTAIESRIMFSQSDDCGANWTRPVQLSNPADKVNQGATVAVDPKSGAVYVAWRQFGMTVTDTDSVMVAKMPAPGRGFDAAGRVRKFNAHRPSERLRRMIAEHQGGDADEVAEIQPFDQGTAEDRIRTNAYPTMAIDDDGRAYVAWTERGFGKARPNSIDPVTRQPLPDGDARVVISTSRNGAAWTAPQPVDAGNGAAMGTPGADMPGHQLMPSISFAAGKLVVVYYDLREDVSRVFGPFIDEGDAIATVRKRHTIDIRAVYALKGDAPVFGPSQQVSQYLQGNLRGSTQVGPLQANAPLLPLFKLGTVPFLGDYIDIAPSPAFVQNAKGVWGYNATAQAAPVFHVVWTDNRDVQKPLDGDWTHYTPVGAADAAGKYTGAPSCVAGQAGMRNQNIYSARLTWGLVAGSPGNTKPLDPTMPRGFVVFAQNTTTATKTFRFSIPSQPIGGFASFTQAPVAGTAYPLLSLDVSVAPKSMVTRTVFVTSSDPKAQVPVDIKEVTAPNQSIVTGGLASRVVLNPDVSNPEISNPEISNPEISNPEISNAEVYNPEISNPEISNPEISNPEISNPEISNPEISNIVIANPEISNPEISNPEISNPEISNPEISNPEISNLDIANGAITDVTWTIVNTGNTTASFNVNLFLANAAAKLAGPGGTGVSGGIKTQLVVHKSYTTPIALGCSLKQEPHTVLVANVLFPKFYEPGTGTAFDPANPDVTNTTLWLEPGGEGKITLRIVDPNPTDGITIDPVHDVTPVITAEPKNTTDIGTPVTPPSTTPPAMPSVSIAFTAQPTNTAVDGIIAPISVHAQIGGAPGAGVQVTLAIAINPAGGHLNGTTTKLTDAAGNVTFDDLSIEKAGTGYRLSASASAAGAVPDLSVPFNIGAGAPPPPPPPLPPSNWSASGDGIVNLLNSGFVGGTPQMNYQHNGDGVNGTPSGDGPYSGAWTLSTAAAANGNVKLDWEWAGFHSYFGAQAHLEVFVNRGGPDVFVAPLLQLGPTFACGIPCPGFFSSGTTTVAVQAGDTFGFRLSGSHGDSAETLAGSFGVVVDGATSANPYVVTNASDSGPGSLRAALTAANANPDVNTITFAIPGNWVHTIGLQTPLPVVSNPVVINGLSQPGAVSMAPMVNLDGRVLQVNAAAGVNLGQAPGFEVTASNVTIAGLSINRFPGPGVYLNNGTNAVHVEDNTIGVAPASLINWPANSIGVHANYSSNHVIARNVISANMGSGVVFSGGGGSTVTGNRIGLSADGSSAVPNGDNGITLFDGAPGTIIDGNFISGNAHHGVDAQSGLAPVTGLQLVRNTIGLAGDGLTALPNQTGGVRLDSTIGAVVGTVGAGNVISGNNGSGIAVFGPLGGVATSIAGNNIGADATGVFARGNGADGVFVDTSASKVTVQSNVIFGNGGLGIALNGAANNSQSAPTLVTQGTLSAGGNTVVDVTLASPPGVYAYQFFTGASCGAAAQLILSTTAGSGAQAIELNSHVPAGTWLTATATDALGNTSQLAPCVQVVPAAPAGPPAVITSVSPANGKSGEGFLVLRGANLPSGVLDSNAVIVSGAGTSAGQVFTSPSTPTAVWVRLQGAAQGPATIQLKNNAGTIVSNAFAITVTANPGTPVITNVYDAGFGVVAGPVAAGTSIYVAADGIDTTGAVIHFVQGANSWDVAAGAAVSSAALGLAVQANLPGDASTGLIDVSIRQGASALSAPVTISVSNPGFIGLAGGPGGNPFGPVKCNPGTVMTALTGEAGSYMGQMTMWCAPVQAGPSLGAAVPTAIIGIPGVGPVNFGAALTCPANSVMTGIHGLAGNVGWGVVVASMGVDCIDITTAGTYSSGLVGGGAPNPYNFACPAGQEVIGFAGGFGGVLDRIGIVCGNPVPPAPVPSETDSVIGHGQNDTAMGPTAFAEPAWFDPRQRQLR